MAGPANRLSALCFVYDRPNKGASQVMAVSPFFPNRGAVS